MLITTKTRRYNEPPQSASGRDGHGRGIQPRQKTSTKLIDSSTPRTHRHLLITSTRDSSEDTRSDLQQHGVSYSSPVVPESPITDSQFKHIKQQENKFGVRPMRTERERKKFKT
ncbi:hypothetical protein E2P81_ATG05598 [Venturia nashicola]|nr:hypothetical protein E2P81_ATG05598 [Venturia nashicola]